MKKIIKVIKILFISVCVIGCFSTIQENEVVAETTSDFEADEDYYYDLCSSTGLTTEEKETCTQFRSYIADKQEELEEEMDELESSISELKSNIANEGQKIAEYSERIDELDSQITAIETSISKIETNIEALNAQIAEREANIESLNNQIKASLVVTQSANRTNSYISFIMGATSFVDLFRRISAVNELTSYSYTKMQEMEEEKVLLESDVEELQEQKDSLTQSQAELETTKASLEKLQALTEELIAEFQRQEAELEEQWESASEDFTALDEALESIDDALKYVSSSSSFGYPFKNKSFRISASGFYYAGGGFHAALDIAGLGYSTSIYAIANGYVFAVGSGCSATGGYLGNTCNSGRGNYVFYIVEVDGKYYSVYCQHLSSVNVSVGDVVYKGQTIIGVSGNSGNTSGAHLHLAIYYQGTTSETTIEEIIQRYKRYGIRFGLSYNYSGTCTARNWKAPCFEDVSAIYGWYYPNSYYVGG